MAILENKDEEGSEKHKGISYSQLRYKENANLLDSLALLG